MNTLLYINSFFILVLLAYVIRRENRLYFSISKNTYFDKITGINVMWSKRPLIEKYGSARGIFYIPISNYKKLETKEDVEKLMKPDNPNVVYTLTAKFSWLKTIEEVMQFEKDYKIVDPITVQKLVDNFNNSLTQK